MKPYAGTLGFGLSAVANSVSLLDSSVVAATGGARVAGEYAAVSRWVAPIGLISQALTQVAFPRLSSKTEVDGSTELRQLFRKVLLSVPVLVLISLLAPTIVPSVLGEKYGASVPTLQIICLALFFSMLSQPLNAALCAWRMEYKTAAAVGCGQFVQLIAQGILGHLSGAPGAAAGAAVGQSLTLLLLAIAYRRALWRGLDDGGRERAAPPSTTVQTMSGASAAANAASGQ